MKRLILAIAAVAALSASASACPRVELRQGVSSGYSCAPQLRLGVEAPPVYYQPEVLALEVEAANYCPQQLNLQVRHRQRGQFFQRFRPRPQRAQVNVNVGY
jgi:hypothetical protein